nr:MAG TPA: hypothetical protein [Inoviridae sp.]
MARHLGGQVPRDAVRFVAHVVTRWALLPVCRCAVAFARAGVIIRCVRAYGANDKT